MPISPTWPWLILDRRSAQPPSWDQSPWTSPAVLPVKLGVIIDSYLRFDKHAATVVKACNYHNTSRAASANRRNGPHRRLQHSRIEIGLPQRCSVAYRCSDDDDQQVAAGTEQPRQGSVQVQWSDGRSTYSLAALATVPRAYHLQGGCTDI